MKAIKNLRIKTLVSLLTTVIMLTLLLPSSVMAVTSYPLSTSDIIISEGLSYLAAQQNSDGSIGDFATSAWAVMALAACEEDPTSWQVDDNPSIVDYLETNAASAATTNEYSRMILAIVAAGGNPVDFGGQNFVTLLESAYSNNQIGDSALLNDDFWGCMALAAAGESPESTILADSITFIADNQNVDGSWSWGVGQVGDVDDTATAIMALLACGYADSATEISEGLAYIKSTQMNNGGFESWGSTNSATDAWAIASIAAAGEDPTSADWLSSENNSPVDDLLSFRNADGSFDWATDSPSNMALMTSYALPALLGIPYPVYVLPQTSVSVHVRIEGQSENIWNGSVMVDDTTITDDTGSSHYFDEPTAMGALDAAALAGDFSYVIEDSAYGLFVSSIDDEEPSGLSGWMYWVDYSSPIVGASEFVLGETTPPDPPHQEVLFAYAEWGQPLLKVEVDNTEPEVDETFTVNVTAYDSASATWEPCEGATVHANQGFTSEADGTVEIDVSSDSTFEVYAQKTGYIRSNRVTVTVGTGASQSGQNHELSMATVITPAISFSIDPESISFGELGPRDTSAPQLVTLYNEGSFDLEITATVSDDAEDLYVDGLKLEGTIWNSYGAIISRDENCSCALTLSVPETYSLTGTQSGTLIFWAVEATS